MLLLSPLNFLLSFPFAAKGWCAWHEALPGSPRARDPSPGTGFLPALGGCWDREVSTPGSWGSEAQGHQGQDQPTPSALLRDTEEVLPGKAAVRVTCGGRVTAHDKGSVSDTGREELVRSPLEERGGLEPSRIFTAAPPNPPYRGPVVLHPRHSSFPHLRSPWGVFPQAGPASRPLQGLCAARPPTPRAWGLHGLRLATPRLSRRALNHGRATQGPRGQSPLVTHTAATRSAAGVCPTFQSEETGAR